MHKLKDYPLYYETTPTDDLDKKIKSRFSSFKVKLVKKGWIAQIRTNLRGVRTEITEIASDPNKAVELLDKRIERMGLYD